MTDHDALLHTILANPDDDVARLVYADFLEDGGDTDRAAFIRQQIDLAKVPAWEPLAVHLKYFAPHILTGQPWRHTLPWADGWNPSHPFHRGLGYAVKVRYLRNLLEYGDQLFASAPLGELHLPGGDMDEYREVIQHDWMSRIKTLRFWDLRTPTEPIRAICETRVPLSLETIRFDKASSTGMYTIVESLVQSRIAPQLRELLFHVGHGSQSELIEALDSGHPLQLERLTFDNLGLDWQAMQRLGRSPVLQTVKELTFANLALEEEDLNHVMRGLGGQLERLTFHTINYRVGTRRDTLRRLANRRAFPNLRCLDLTKSAGMRHEQLGFLHNSLPGLRSLRLGGMRIQDTLLGQIASSPYWPNLVELDLSENQLTDAGAQFLLDAPPAKELIALDLRGNPFSANMLQLLVEQFGDRVLIE
jgi:uncharacterized protein (TIGR02996 family)